MDLTGYTEALIARSLVKIPNLDPAALVRMLGLYHVKSETVGGIMQQLTKQPEGWVTIKQISAEASKYFAETGISAAVVVSIALTESSGAMWDHEVYMNPSVQNSLGYKGLFQFDPAGIAWRQAQSGKLQIGSFATSWNKMPEAVKAVMVYSRQNYEEFKRLTGYKGVITPEIVYLTHNQGAGGGAQFVEGTHNLRGVQSRVAIEIAQAAKSQFMAVMA